MIIDHDISKKGLCESLILITKDMPIIHDVHGLKFIF